jgi:ribosomal protection tetracycline resistance protein
VTALTVFDDGRSVNGRAAVAGRIARLWGLTEVQVGDEIGSPAPARSFSFAPPTLESMVVPRSGVSRSAVHTALAQLAEQDPLINLRRGEQLFVSIYGEVQKEVIQATLATEFGLDVDFRETTPICVERPIGSGAAVETLGEPSNPFLATVGLRVEPGSGVSFRTELGVRSIPLYVYKTAGDFSDAMGETVRTTLEQGLYGWQVVDWTVTMTDSGYSSPDTTSGDFRKLTPLVLMRALHEAGTEVCEPVHSFRLDVPADSLHATLRALARLGAVPQPAVMSGSSYAIEGTIAAVQTHRLQQELRALTHGEGVLEFAFDHYRPVSGTAPTRPRTDHNPLSRDEYLMHLARRTRS